MQGLIDLNMNGVGEDGVTVRVSRKASGSLKWRYYPTQTQTDRRQWRVEHNGVRRVGGRVGGQEGTQREEGGRREKRGQRCFSTDD